MLTVIEPLTGQTPWQGISIVAGVGCQSADLAFLDGWGAGHLAGMPLRQLDLKNRI